MLQRWLRYAVFLALSLALTLASVYLVFHLAQRVPEHSGRLVHGLAVGGVLLAGVIALLGAVHFAMRIAVALLAKEDVERSGS